VIASSTIPGQYPIWDKLSTCFITVQDEIAICAFKELTNLSKELGLSLRVGRRALLEMGSARTEVVSLFESVNKPI
jgi:hypothetical protein